MHASVNSLTVSFPSFIAVIPQFFQTVHCFCSRCLWRPHASASVHLTGLGLPPSRCLGHLGKSSSKCFSFLVSLIYFSPHQDACAWRSPHCVYARMPRFRRAGCRSSARLIVSRAGWERATNRFPRSFLAKNTNRLNSSCVSRCNIVSLCDVKSPRTKSWQLV